ncbi:MAG: STAS domain-containing protein [Solirubrobacterales bacterium]|nr:STAS domain-containing protein [Solirubrobacterales bacterium]
MPLDATALPDEFGLQVTTRPGAAVVAVRGEVDMAVAPELQAAIQGLADCPLVVLECSQVSFCDSSGLRTIVGEERRLRGAGTHLVIAAPSDRLRDVLQATQLHRVLSVADTLDAALAAQRPAA